MARPKPVPLDLRFFSPLPGGVEILDSGLFLAAVRVIRTGDSWQAIHAPKGTFSAYGLREDQWIRMSGKYQEETSKIMVESMCYRWFVKCWHELILAGLDPTPYRVAVLWDKGIKDGLKRINRHNRFAAAVAKHYKEANEQRSEIPINRRDATRDAEDIRGAIRGGDEREDYPQEPSNQRDSASDDDSVCGDERGRGRGSARGT